MIFRFPGFDIKFITGVKIAPVEYYTHVQFTNMIQPYTGQNP